MQYIAVASYFPQDVKGKPSLLVLPCTPEIGPRDPRDGNRSILRHKKLHDFSQAFNVTLTDWKWGAMAMLDMKPSLHIAWWTPWRVTMKLRNYTYSTLNWMNLECYIIKVRLGETQLLCGYCRGSCVFNIICQAVYKKKYSTNWFMPDLGIAIDTWELDLEQ